MRNFLLLLIGLCSSLQAEIRLDSSIYRPMSFSSQYMDDGALIFNVDFSSVYRLVPLLEKKYGVKLQDRGEAHITVITPPEGEGWFSPDHQGILDYIQLKELHRRYRETLQKARFSVECVGRLKKEDREVFYLVVESADLRQVRQDIEKEVKSRAAFSNKKAYFDASAYDPHITIGFVGGDIHGISKGRETCVEDVKISDR